jgi:FkbM family methyltransferase
MLWVEPFLQCSRQRWFTPPTTQVAMQIWPQRYMPSPSLSFAFLAVSSCLPGATVIDAGAHVCTISVALARQLGSSSTVIAKEAIRFFASLSRANAVAAGLQHIHVIHAAFGDTSGCLMARSDHLPTTVSNNWRHAMIQCPQRVRRACAARNCAIHGETFFVGLGTYDWCSFPCQRHLCGIWSTLTHDCRVPTMRVHDLGLQRCDILKMDAEAMEGAVAQGARRTIETLKP